MSDLAPSPEKMLAETWPYFLKVMEFDLPRGRRMFMAAGYQYLVARPPKEFFAIPGVDLEDFAAEIVCALVKDDCRRLRKYRDMNRPFVAWLRVVAVRIAIEMIRSFNTEQLRLVYSKDDDNDIFDHIESVLSEEPDDDLGRTIRETIQSFGDHPCHRILWMRYIEEYSNQEISQKSPEGWSNVEVGNRFRRCRLRLMEKLKQKGITPDDLLEG